MHQDKKYQWQTVRSVIKDLEFDHGECATLSEERLKFLTMVPEGGNWRDLPEDIIPIAMGGAYKSGGGKVGFYRRLSYDQPSPTVVTSPVQKATMMCHPTQNRPLSVKEYARIQQFPDDWVFTGTTAAKYRQIGNAVPVGLAEAIGKTSGCYSSNKFCCTALVWHMIGRWNFLEPFSRAISKWLTGYSNHWAVKKWGL